MMSFFQVASMESHFNVVIASLSQVTNKSTIDNPCNCLTSDVMELMDKETIQCNNFKIQELMQTVAIFQRIILSPKYTFRNQKVNLLIDFCGLKLCSVRHGQKWKNYFIYQLARIINVGIKKFNQITIISIDKKYLHKYYI